VLLLVGLPTGQVDFDEPVRGARLGVLQSIDSRTDSHGVITGLFTPKTAKSVPFLFLEKRLSSEGCPNSKISHARGHWFESSTVHHSSPHRIRR
jgi:hypothetical protein